jgi:hypothetical protein
MSTPTTALRAPAGAPKVPAAWSQRAIFANHPFPPMTPSTGASLRFVEAYR